MYTFDVERMFILHQNSGGIGKSIPSILDISSTLLGCRGWISQYLLCFGGARIPLSGNLTFGISLRSQEISRVSGMDFPIPPSFLVEHRYHFREISWGVRKSLRCWGWIHLPCFGGAQIPLLGNLLGFRKSLGC